MSITHIGLSGLMASQTGLNMASRNTANLLTTGYTRQGVLLSARVGGGVEVNALLRYADTYKSQQLWSTQAQEGRYGATESYFRQLEEVMGLGEGSVKGGVDAFFATLDEVSTEPTSVPLRQQVISAADNLVKRFDSLRQTLFGQLEATRQQAFTIVDQANTLADTIARLNERIGEAAATGGAPSELLDQRDRAIGELATLVGVRVVHHPDGMVDVSLENGPPLVAGKLAGRMQAVTAANGTFSLGMTLGGSQFGLVGERMGGSLGGLYGYANDVLVTQLDSTHALASELATRINASLTAGYGTDGLPGSGLFVIDAASGRISLDPAATQARLGFSSSATEPGNSDNLAAIIDVRTQTFALPGLGTVSIGDAYTMMVGKLGSDSKSSQASLETAATLREQAHLSLLSISGVNSEEEVIRISELLQAYQANMKVISVANELFDTTLNAL
ncbi:flagellar hook-associated protein FlgK [Xanthomonas sp. XNM01]|uniref:flagellar hook-associated protein FlgK n=1 Tax=Xanthomonas sp. XNM01 TaxID=2769289 RepID=UPI00177E2A2A|nr:flagellar hook-associated protein FlgK [Xanthomonas sp. XNM01]MBD9370954.1 flagellar hook-associated protein FlgK [Xanthomonas sp. XNM01]